MTEVSLSESLMSGFRMPLDELVRIVNGEMVVDGGGTPIKGIGTDTRLNLKGRLFVPFQGEKFDGHDFLQKAEEQGAAAALIHREVDPQVFKTMKLVKVENTLMAFQCLARHWRQQLCCKVLAITGSNGKTTTKEFCAAILSPHLKTYWSQKSFNNHWGVPISLLSIESEHEVALLEMGMNHLGELKKLCEVAEPDVAIVTFVGKSHLEGLGSVEGVAKGKEEIYFGCKGSGVGIFNLDNSHTKKMYERHRQRFQTHITFSSEKKADVFLKIESADLKSLKISGEIAGVAGQADIPIFGKQNLTNLMAAGALALSVGLEPEKIWQGFARCRPSWGRGELYKHRSGAEILFDAYNANPESMRVLFENLALIDSARGVIAVLGEMAELGKSTEEEHYNLGQAVARSRVRAVCFVGRSKAAFRAGFESGGSSKSLIVSDVYEESLAIKIANMLEPEDIAVVKGSRSVGLERLLSDWGLLD